MINPAGIIFYTWRYVGNTNMLRLPNPAGIIFYTWRYVGNTNMLRLPRAPFWSLPCLCSVNKFKKTDAVSSCQFSLSCHLTMLEHVLGASNLYCSDLGITVKQSYKVKTGGRLAFQMKCDILFNVYICVPKWFHWLFGISAISIGSVYNSWA